MHRFEHLVYAKIMYLFQVLVTILNKKYIISRIGQVYLDIMYLSYQNDTRTIILNSKYYSYEYWMNDKK